MCYPYPRKDSRFRGSTMPNLEADWLNWKSAKISLQFYSQTISWPKTCLCCGKRDATAHRLRYEGNNPKKEWLTVPSYYCDFCWHHVELAKRPEPQGLRDISIGVVFLLVICSSLALAMNDKFLFAGALFGSFVACFWFASRTSWYKGSTARWEQIKQQKILQREAEVLASLGPNCTAKASAIKAVWPSAGGIDLHFANDGYGEAFLKVNQGKPILRS